MSRRGNKAAANLTGAISFWSFGDKVFCSEGAKKEQSGTS